jgi:PEP-CTERM motif
MTTGDYVVVNGKQYLDVGGYETINLHDQNIPFGGNETVSGACDVDCPTGYSGLIDVYDFNSANGSTGVYGPYPGVGSITGNYELFVESIGPEGVGVYNYTATYSTDSVSLVTNAAVPEPSTWALILLGLAGLGFESYRHGRRAIL